MSAELIRDRGRGPEIVGTRITVYNLLPHFLDSACTEDAICRNYQLTAAQVAAARAYVLRHPDEVLAEHLKIESRIQQGNPAEVIDQAKKTHQTFQSFKEWLSDRNNACGIAAPANTLNQTAPQAFPTFAEWRTRRESRSEQGS